MKMAVDIGGTYLRYFLDRTYKVKLEDIDVQSFLQDLIQKHRIEAIAISFAGQVCCGRILSAPNVKAPFQPQKLGIPYIVENDLNCAALAEARYFGAAFLVALYSGTGLGSGIIEDGKLCRGSENLAGEIGHIPYKKAPFRCGCGKDNCIELYTSGSGLKKWGRYKGCAASLEESCVKEEYLRAITHAAATMLTLCNPKLLVLGGGVIKSNPFVVEYVKEHIRNYAPPFSLLPIEFSRLQEPSLEGAKILLEEL